jgi:glycosyltransferase involved in cell wall biosynthesis
VVPFYNTAEHLAECVESILEQTYEVFEVLLVNNCSTDGSVEIAERFAAEDPRIRLVHNTAFVGQVENYNGAVAQASPEARYLKIVQADDVIFPTCLAQMVAAGEMHPSALIITSYYVKGRSVMGSGVPWGKTLLTGREALRLHLLEGNFLFGSPTTVMYRASLVRQRVPFFPVGPVHEDTELIYEVLTEGDVAFVHDILTYLRVREGSILAGLASYDWQALDFYVIVKKFGRRYLTAEEYQRCEGLVARDYLRALGAARFFRRESGYWAHHVRTLKSCGETIPGALALLPYTMRTALSAMRHPHWARERFRASRAARDRERAGH